MLRDYVYDHINVLGIDSDTALKTCSVVLNLHFRVRVRD